MALKTALRSGISLHSFVEPAGVRLATAALGALLCLGALAGCSASAPPATAPDGTAGETPSEGSEASRGSSDSGASAEPARRTPKRIEQAVAELMREGAADGSGEDEAQAEEAEANEPKHAIDYPQPPDGEWLTDDEGRQYFVHELPKREGLYKRLGENRVRLRFGIAYDLAGETEDSFLVKIYRAEPLVREADSEPTKAEIAAVGRSYEAELPERGDVSFRDFGEGLPQSGQWRNGFDLADMNGDGEADLVHGPPRRSPGPPVVFLGDGRGTWRRWVDVRVPRAPYDYGDAEATDFDGDGSTDLALAVHLSGLLVLAGDGSGDFERWSEGLDLAPAGQASAKTFVSREIETLDWNGDGLEDLVALSEGPRHPKATERQQVASPLGLAVYLNRGDGTWSSAPLPDAESDLFGDSLAQGDVDGDGRTDVVAATNAQGERGIVFLNRGERIEVVEVDGLRPRAFVWAVATADFDRDGLDDLVVSTTARQAGRWWSSLDVLITRATEEGVLTFERQPLLGGEEEESLKATAVATGDLDGDGRPDVAAATANGMVRAFFGADDGSFAAMAGGAISGPFPGCQGFHVELLDLDRDGADEIVASFAGEECAGGGSLRAWKPLTE